MKRIKVREGLRGLGIEAWNKGDRKRGCEKMREAEDKKERERGRERESVSK